MLYLEFFFQMKKGILPRKIQPICNFSVKACSDAVSRMMTEISLLRPDTLWYSKVSLTSDLETVQGLYPQAKMHAGS